MQKEIIKLTQKLIRIDSTKNKPKQLLKVIKVVEDYFKNTPLIIKRFQKNHKPSIVITFENTQKPQFFLNGHLDVVEAKKNQFKPKIKGDRIYGRGANDMKGVCAAMMVLIKHLALQNKKPPLGLMLTTDEEIGGTHGVKYLLEEKGYSCQTVFIPDGSKGYDLITEEKGVFHFKLISKGKSAHGSRPWLGKNAIDQLIEAYQELKKLYPNPKNEQDWRISLNLGKIQGGEAPNKIPDEAEMYLDLRYPKNFKLENIFKQIKKIDPELKLEIIAQGLPLSTSEKNSYLQTYKKTAEKVLKQKLRFKKEAGASDARFFSERKIPVILTASKGGDSHGKEEWVSISGLEKTYQILKKFIQAIN